MASVEIDSGHVFPAQSRGTIVFQDGMIVSHVKNGSTAGVYYSTDDGATWTLYTLSIGGVSGQESAMTSVKNLDGYVAVTFRDASNDGGLRLYTAEATGVGGFTQIGAEKEFDTTMGGAPIGLDAFYHSGDDTVYFIVVWASSSGNQDNYSMEVWGFDLTAETWNSTASSTTTDVFGRSAGTDTPTQVEVVMVCDDGDDFTPSQAYPDFWLVSKWNDGDTQVFKSTQVTGPTWSTSAGTIVKTVTYTYGNLSQSFWDGTRLVVTGLDSSGNIWVKERNAANTTTTDRTPGTEPTGGRSDAGYTLGAGWGGSGQNIHVVTTTNVSNGDTIYAKYDRAADTWDSAYTVIESAGYGGSALYGGYVVSASGGALTSNKLYYTFVVDTFNSHRWVEVAEESFGPVVSDTTISDADTLNVDTLQPWVITGTTLVDADTLNTDVLQPMRITDATVDDSTDTFNTDLLSRVIAGTTLDDSADTFNADTLMYGFPDNEFIEVDVLNLDTFYRIFDTDTFIDDSTDTLNADQLVQGLIEGTFLTDGDTLNLDTLYFTLIEGDDLGVSPVWMYQLVRRGGNLYHAPMRPSYGWSGDDVVSSPFRYNTAYEDYLNKVIHATWIWHNEDDTATLKALMNTALGTAGFEDQAGDVLT